MLIKSIQQIAEEVALIGPRIGRKIMADLVQVGDIPHAQLFVLMFLFNQGAMRFSDICHELRVSAPTGTGIISRLQKAGYVKRVAEAQDRRTVLVVLTPQGRKLSEKLRKLLVERWSDIFANISHEDANKYLEILKKISEGL